MKSRIIASESDLFLVGQLLDSHQTSVTLHVVMAIGLAFVGLILGATSGDISQFFFFVSMSGVASFAVVSRPQRRIHHEAEEIRRQLEMATAVFLDLINVLLAGGAGIETSVVAASHAGDGPGFSIIRMAVMRAQSARLSYWDSLAEIGRVADVPTLMEVAHTVQLAGQHGARIRTSLASKAEALRKRNLAQVEFEEEQRTEKIGLPLVVMFLGFLVLVGYPAFSQTMTSF